MVNVFTTTCTVSRTSTFLSRSTMSQKHKNTNTFCLELFDFPEDNREDADAAIPSLRYHKRSKKTIKSISVLTKIKNSFSV